MAINELVKKLVRHVAICGIVYVVFSLYLKSFNPNEWGMLITLGFVCSVITVDVLGPYASDLFKKQNEKHDR